MMKQANEFEQKPKGFVGVGLDNTDGETRITRGKNFALLGGSEETHAVMQETAIKINETLDLAGKHIEEISHDEFRNIVMDVTERIGRHDN